MSLDQVDSMVVAVDGPAAAGKTTTSLAVAEIFDMKYLESGRAYRILACEALRTGVDPDDATAMLRLGACISGSGRGAGLLGLDRYSARELRSSAVNRAVSVVAKITELRAMVTESVHAWAGGNRRSIIEGRDIGTVVFPSAPAKFYLTAAAETRARRRVEQEGGGSYAEILEDVRRRDHADMNRPASPLVPAPDAIVIDTTAMSVGEVVDRMVVTCRASGLVTGDR